MKELAEIWPSYKENIVENKDHRAFEIINKLLPDELEKQTPNSKNIQIDSSGGAGYITAGPWLAALDNRVTASPQTGYYVVFVFSVDMKKIVLELGYGTNQFTKFYGDNKDTREKIRNAAVLMQRLVSNLILNFKDQKFISRLSLDESDLSTTNRNTLQIGYEKASIFNISYDILSLKSSSIVSDYLKFLELYRSIVESGLAPSMDELFEQTLNLTTLIDSIPPPIVTSFEPRKPAKRSRPGNVSENTKNYRHSSNSKKIGDLGETVVLNYEISKLKTSNLQLLSTKVIHEEAENRRPGWDISSFDVKGNPILIEVKASTGNTINNLTITVKEWNAAIKHGDNYFLYLVTNLKPNKTPEIEIIQNPAKLLNEGKFILNIASYDLKLFN
jgi:hypothetical protein